MILLALLAFLQSPAAEVVHPPAPADWSASAQDEADVRRFVADYFAKLDAGAFDAALAAHDAERVPDRAQWFAEKQAALAQAGPGTGRRITSVSWYVNPAEAPWPGVFVGADFAGDYAGVHADCGYLGIYRRGPGDYVILREEVHRLAKSEPLGDAAAIQARVGEICPNLRTP